MGFIKTILILVVVFYLIGFIGRVLIPIFIKRQVKKFQQNSYDNSNQEQKKEGEITINSKLKKDNLLDVDDAEDVDFEEID